MNIGIYKPGKKVFFYENTEDHASWSKEVTDIAHILADNGNQVYFMTETDLRTDVDFTNIFRDIDPSIKLDRIFVFSGVFHNGSFDLYPLQKYTNDIRFIATDLALLPSNLDEFSKVFSQSESLYTYGHIEEHECLYSDVFQPELIEKKGIYFGGTERNRRKTFLEYVWRPNVEWRGKSEFLGIKNYVPFDEHMKLLKAAKYSIIIGDEAYNEVGFVTPRYYECIRNNVIAFVDVGYDKNETLISHQDYRRVSSYEEMMEKIKYLEANDFMYRQLLSKQYFEVDYLKRSGANIYRAIMA